MTDFQLSMNRQLALWLREAHRLREASWDPERHKRPWFASGSEYWVGEYTKSRVDCIREVVGDNPIALILECLLVPGYCEIWDFCDEVLGPEAPAKQVHSEQSED